MQLAAAIKSAGEAAPGQRRDAYYCTDQGCWVAEQYFCDETGCYLTGDAPVDLGETFTGKVVATPKKVDKSAPPEKTIVQEGIFAPAVKLTAQAMGRKELVCLCGSSLGHF